MSDLKLTKKHLSQGVWEGILHNMPSDDKPEIQVLHMDLPVPDIEVIKVDDQEAWALRIPIPFYAIADGVQTFTVFDKSDDTKLGHFTLVADEALADDIRGEVDLLRAELDMLKRAFRRHCLETT
jgi:hypothetical protein